MSERQDNGFNVQNELNYFLSMKVLNGIKQLICNKDYLQIKDKLKRKYEPVFELASEI